jgi:peroxiredoxin Q/BCP
MPAVVFVDRRGEAPEIACVHRGGSSFDRPDADDVLVDFDALREG